MILAEQLSKRFDDFLAVDQVSFQVNPGEILVLLGPNGAGKTTTVRMLTSILRPTSGSATILGYDVVKDADQVRALVGVLTEHHGLYGRMTANEYLDFFGQLYHLAPKVRKGQIGHLLEQFGMAPYANKRMGEFSKGMRQKLALVRAMLHDPPVLLLDEPTSAMDPESSRIVRESIRKLRSTERSIILCTHNLVEAETLADKIAIIRKGRIILIGKPGDLKKRLIGKNEFEVHLARSIAPESYQIPDGVKLIAQGSDWVRFQVDVPEIANPALLRNLLDQNLPIISLQEVTPSLEQVYINAVTQADPENGNVVISE
jgi:ABC-2 type transport system ATP-binding protein